MKETTFVFHFVNVHEEEDKVIIDAIHYSDFPPNSESNTSFDVGAWNKAGSHPKCIPL